MFGITLLYLSGAAAILLSTLNQHMDFDTELERCIDHPEWRACQFGSPEPIDPYTREKISDIVVNITQFGGVGDGQTSNTDAFVKAISAIKSAGGGALFVPRGVWLTGPFNLTSHMTLFVDSGATILGSTDLSEWYSF